MRKVSFPFCQLFTSEGYIIFLFKTASLLDFHPVQKLLIQYNPRKEKKIPLCAPFCLSATD